MGRGAARGWPGRLTDRIRFEAGARAAFPGLRGAPARGANRGGFRYTGTVEVPCYETREITILFPPGSRIPIVHADGPTSSPHRYDDGALCMWHPTDPATQRWRFDHGLLDLLDTIRGHLFREAHWRESPAHGWLGPEVPHLDTIGRDLQEAT